MFEFILRYFRKKKLAKLIDEIEVCEKCKVRPVFKGRGNKETVCKNYSIHGNCKGVIIKRNDICFCGSGKKYKACCNKL
jgi:uncharacterized protein YecA (UPF0149 family)